MKLNVMEMMLVLINRRHRVITFGDGSIVPMICNTWMPGMEIGYPAIAFFSLKFPVGTGSIPNWDDGALIQQGQAHFVFKNRESLDLLRKWLDRVESLFPKEEE
jgi:hypothetical protein